MTITLSLRINIAQRFVVTLIVLMSAVPAFGTAPDSARILNDTAAITLRAPDEAVQQDVFTDDDWKYITEENKSSSDEGFFSRLFADLLESLFDDMDAPDLGPPGSRPVSSRLNWWSIFFTIIGVGLIVFFIIKATGAGGNTLFKGKTKRKVQLDPTVEDVDIHAIDYDREIAGATSRNDYRFAVRLWFLRSLKEMADHQLINWKIDKTNSDYYYELSGSKLQKQFGSVSLLYDYVWYGEFKLSELKYQEAENELRGFFTNVKQAEVKK